MKLKTIAILGSTGSIGQSTLEIIKRSKEYKVEILVANKNYFKIISQIKYFKPNIVIINNKKIYFRLKKNYNNKKIIVLNNVKDVQDYKKKLMLQFLQFQELQD